MPPIPPEAIAVLEQFLDASLRKDEPAMRACLSKNTLETANFSPNGPENVTFSLGEPEWEGDNLLVPVTATPNDPDTGNGMQLPVLLVNEDGAWKIDLATSMDRMMGGSMQETIDQLATTMSQAVGAIGTAFADGMSQAFGTTADSDKPPIPDWSLVPLVPCVDEILPLPEFVTLPKLSAALSEALGTDILAQAAMKDLLQQVASDQEKVLTDWFEDQLFASWPALLAEINTANPLAGRLRALRIEAAAWHDQRTLALDANDLVYRLFINDQAGYYSDDELATILPGVLAGLPHDLTPALANYRFLPNDNEYPDWRIYKDRIVPRFMRRISDLLGKPIRLEADFDDVYDTSTAARQLPRWGIARVYGALALACLDDDLRYRLIDSLHTLKLKMAHDDPTRFASFDNGTFEVGIRDFLGEAGCFYEYQLLGPLTGEPIAREVDALPADSADAAPAFDAANFPAESDATTDDDADDTLLDLTNPDQATPAEPDAQPDPADAAAARNRELFTSAVDAMRQNGEPAWRQQLELVLGRPVALTLDYDVLGGQHDRLMPFIHQSLTAGLGAVSILAFDPAFKPRLAPVQEVFITAPPEGQPPSASLVDATLRLAVPMDREGPPAVEPVAAAIRAALGDAPAQPSRETSPLRTAFEVASTSDWSSAKPSPTPNDPYKQAAAFMDELQSTMKADALWPGDKPPGDLEVKGAFGSENMALEQWLAWVLIPRVRDIVLTRGSFPNGSNVAGYAVREFSGMPNADATLDVLSRFDEFVNNLANNPPLFET